MYMYTVLSQIEACMNSRPFVVTQLVYDDDGIEVLTPGSFSHWSTSNDIT